MSKHIIPQTPRILLVRRTANGTVRNILATPPDVAGLAVMLKHRQVNPASVIRIEGIDRDANGDYPVIEHVSAQQTGVAYERR